LRDGSTRGGSRSETPRRVGFGLALALAAAILLAACAVVEPPPGGPKDEVRPHLVTMSPDSGSMDLGVVSKLELTFSEKMDRVSAFSWLHFYPDQRIRQTKWHGATRAEVTLEEPLPPDTLVIVEIAGGMRDAHRVANRRGRLYPITTGGDIPGGQISGVLVMADSAVSNGVVELYDVPPDTLEYFQQSLLRRTTTDKTGAYLFDWLPTSGGPWLLRAFADADGDLRPGEREAQRLLPDTLGLSAADPVLVAGVTTLYPYNTPGRLLIAPFADSTRVASSLAWTMQITEEDTGWVPVPVTRANFAPLDPAAVSEILEVAPGANRLLVFVDVDGDSTFSGVPDSALTTLPDTLRGAYADSVISHWLEPWFMLENLEVSPGLATDVTLPAVALTYTPWTPPEPTRADSLAAAPDDSLLNLLPSAADSAQVLAPETD